MRRIRLLVWAHARQGIVDIGDGRNAAEEVNLRPLDAVGIAAAIHVLVMLARADGKHGRARHLHAEDHLAAPARMLTDDVELFLGKAPLLVQDALRHTGLAQIVQQRPQGQLVHAPRIQVAQRADDSRQHGHVHAVRKRVHIIGTNIIQLHQILASENQISDDGISCPLHRFDIHELLLLEALKQLIHMVYGHVPCLLLQDVFWQLNEKLWHRRGHVELADAELAQALDILLCQRDTLDQIAGALGIINTLHRHHARSQILGLQLNHAAHQHLPIL